ncbi:amylase-3 protein precursor, partial [Silurus meridionalis]
VRDCRLVSLLDLALEKDYVRSKVSEYMNKLIDMGVAGFRVDACKHMWPGDLNAVYSNLNNLNTQWFSSGSRPFIYQEVLSFTTLCVCAHILKMNQQLLTNQDSGFSSVV